MPQKNPYILQAGSKIAAERLALLDEIYGPYTHNFLNEIDIKPGMSILDVGCGTGNVTCWLAKKVGEKGLVVGVDSSESQLNIAKEQAAALNLNNIKFLHYSVYEIDKIPTAFDVVYSRFLLVHLDQPVRALELMYSLVKSQGVLACDEQCLDAALTYPDSEAFIKSKELTKQITEKRNLDFLFGKKLYSVFQKFNFNTISLQVIQPTLTTSYRKNIWLLFFEEAKNEFLNTGIINDADFEAMLNGLREIVNNESSYILPMRNFQICGRKN